MIITDQMVDEAKELYRQHKDDKVPFLTIAMEVVKKHGAQGEEVGHAMSDLNKAWATRRKVERRERFARSWGRHKVS